MEKVPVPKFTSFKPKPKASSKPTTQEGRVDDKSEREDHHRRHRQDESRRRHHRDHHSRERPSHHELSRRKRSRERRAKTPEVEAPISKDEFEESHLFIVDRRGDAKNIEYGSLHRYSIPAYRRTGYGKILGLSESTKIDRDESSDKEIRLKPAGRDGGQKTPRWLTSKHARTNESKLRFVMFTSDHNDSTESDFIELRPSRKRKRGSESPEAETSHVDYRSIEGKAKAPAQLTDDDLEHASESEAEDVDLDLQQRHENAALSKKAKANATDLDAWLALMDHQAKLVRPGVEPASLTSSERKTLADLRLAILNEAALHIKTGPCRERLLRAMISEGSMIWDSAKRASKWREALGECPKSILLWKEYLDYIQDSHVGFRYDTCKETFIQCLRMLIAVRSKHDEISLGQIQIYIFLRLSAFIRDAGYGELAIGLWQALLEYHFHLPRRLRGSPTSECLTAFENFWEGEAPRIGEEHAKGWIQYDENSDSAARSPPKAQQRSPDPRRPYASFAEEESKLQGFALPASTDDDTTSDPFRCVMFTDTRDLLELLGSGLPRIRMIEAFLCFLGLPCLPSEDTESQAVDWMRDTHLAGGFATLSVAADVAFDTEAVKLQCRRETTFSLFHDAFEDFHRLHLPNDDDDRLAAFADRVLEALAAANPQDDDIGEYCLAFKLHKSPVEATKLAKRMLKQRPSSLRLYNAYALIEAKRGNLDKAQNVWTTALSANMGSSGKEGHALTWHSRMLSQCRAGQDATCLRDITSIADISSKAMEAQDSEDGWQVRRLKARRLLEERLDRALLGSQTTAAALLVDCLTWMEYLAHECDINVALQAYKTHSSKIKRSSTSLGLELVQQSKARLLKLHIERQRPFKPAVLRQELEEALKMFPSNSTLLDIHASLVAQDRLRTLVREQKASSSAQMSAVEWSLRIAEELRRIDNEASGSTPNTVRATFAKALLSADGPVKHSPALWFVWLRFECSQADQPRGPNKQDAALRAKQVFMDGLRNLPWVKQWVVMGMRLLSDGTMSQGELRQAYEVLVERGLRLRVDIEDFI